MKIVPDSICSSFEEPQFFVSTNNKIAKVLIDPNPGEHCLVSKKKHIFNSNDQIKATSIVYSVLQSDTPGEKEAFMGVATSDLSFVILRLTKNAS